MTTTKQLEFGRTVDGLEAVECSLCGWSYVAPADYDRDEQKEAVLAQYHNHRDVCGLNAQMQS